MAYYGITPLKKQCELADNALKRRRPVALKKQESCCDPNHFPVACTSPLSPAEVSDVFKDAAIPWCHQNNPLSPVDVEQALLNGNLLAIAVKINNNPAKGHVLLIQGIHIAQNNNIVLWIVDPFDGATHQGKLSLIGQGTWRIDWSLRMAHWHSTWC